MTLQDAKDKIAVENGYEDWDQLEEEKGKAGQFASIAFLQDEAAELYAKHKAMDFMDSIRDYEKEARVMIGFDERTTEELYNTFNKK